MWDSGTKGRTVYETACETRGQTENNMRLTHG